MARADANPIFLHLPSLATSDLRFARLRAQRLPGATERMAIRRQWRGGFTRSKFRIPRRPFPIDGKR
jgi:hypothetical protein